MSSTSRRNWGVSLAICFLLGALAGPGLAQNVVINGVPLATTRTPVTMGGSMLLPMRDVFEALQSEVKWFAPEQKVMAIRGQTTVELWLGKRTATINGVEMQLPVAPMMIGGSTYVPLRFPAEAFGGNVKWDGPTRTAYIDITPLGETPPVTPPVTPPPVTPPVTPPVAVTVEGVVLQVIPAPPALLIQVTGTGLPQAVSVNANTALTRGAEGQPAQAVPLAEARPGDYATAVLTPEGVAATVALAFGAVDGKVLALANGVLVLDDGTAFRLAENLRVVDPAGQAAALNAVAQNTLVTLAFDPRSKLVWEIKLKTPVAPPPTTPPTPDQVQVLTVGWLNPGTAFRSGDRLMLQVKGTPGAQTTATIGQTVRDLPLPEVQPGVYQAEWRVPANLDLRNVPLIADLTVGGTRAPRTTAPTRLTFDSRPPTTVAILPGPGEAINNDSPTIELTYDLGGGTDLNPQSARLWVNRREVTRDLYVGLDRMIYNAQNLAAGPVAVEAVVRDLAGNEARNNWSFTIGAVTGNELIRAAWHDARGVLVTGDTIIAQARVVNPGGVATFDLGGLRRDLPMQRVGTTDKYRGAYTIRAGDRVTNATLTIRYREPGGRTAALDATTRINIDSSLPTTLQITAPANASQVGDVIVVSGQAPPYRRVRVTITYRARVVTWVTGQLWQDVVQTNAQGRWTTPEVGSNVGFFGRADEYVVLAELLDANNAVVGQQQISLRK